MMQNATEMQKQQKIRLSEEYECKQTV